MLLFMVPLKLLNISIIKTPLFESIKNGNIEITDLLLSHPKIDVNILSVDITDRFAKQFPSAILTSNIWDSSPFFTSSSAFISPYFNGSLTPSEWKKTALYLAIEKGEISIIKKLLEKEAINVNLAAEHKEPGMFSDTKKTPLFLAVEKSAYETIGLLLSNPNIDVNEYSTTYNDNNILFDSRSKYQDTSSPLHLAIKKSDIDSIKLLLNHPNIDVNLLNKENDCEKTPLFLAVEKGDREIVNLLLSHPKANANQESKIRNNAISFPNKYGKEVVEYYGNIYYNWMTPLYLAVEKEDEEMVQLLINNEKVDINKTMKTDSKIMNKTALHRAIEVGNQSILRLLLKNDFIDCGCKLIYHSLINTAQYKVKDKYVELSLLCFAIKNGNLETIRTLIEESTIFLNDKSFIEKTIEIVDDDLSLRPENIVKEEIDPILCAIKSNKKDVLQYLLTIPQIDFNCYSKSSNEDLSFDQNTCISSKTSKKLNALQNMTYNIGLIGNKEYNDMNKKKKKVVPNFIEFITMLVDNPRVDINASYYTKITKKKEIFKNNEWVVSTKNKKTFENTAFSFAVEKGFLEVIDILLRHKKIDINRLLNGICENIDKKKKEKSIEKDRYSALHLALFTKKPRAVQKLVDQRNLNINSIYSAELKIAKDKKQTTIKKITKSSFLLAVEKEEINSINILLNSNKVDINAHWICNKNCDIEEKDALFIAIEKKNKDIVNILVNRSDFDFHFIAKNIMGNSSEEYKTHLFAAVENNQYEIAQILLENEKTDVNKKSVFIRPDQSYKKHTLYKTALHIAVEKGFYDIISLLKKYNAEILI